MDPLKNFDPFGSLTSPLNVTCIIGVCVTSPWYFFYKVVWCGVVDVHSFTLLFMMIYQKFRDIHPSIQLKKNGTA
jgi:hypothetical protein